MLLCYQLIAPTISLKKIVLHQVSEFNYEFYYWNFIHSFFIRLNKKIKLWLLKDIHFYNSPLKMLVIIAIVY